MSSVHQMNGSCIGYEALPQAVCLARVLILVPALLGLLFLLKRAVAVVFVFVLFLRGQV